MKKNKGFTLVELLAVITILGIIIIIAIPAALNAVGKSKNKLNEYTEKNIIDSARMYFMDIVEKVDPGKKYYSLKDTGAHFKSNITGKYYNSNPSNTGDIKEYDRIYGYDFVLYALARQGTIEDMTKTSYAGSNYFVGYNNSFVVYNSSSASVNNLVGTTEIAISIKDLVKGGYYDPECVYAGDMIEIYDEDGNKSQTQATKDTNCQVNSECQLILRITIVGEGPDPDTDLYIVDGYDIRVAEDEHGESTCKML